MKILQLDVDNITYELVKPEASVYEESKQKKVSQDDAVVILVSVEKGDNKAIANDALAETLAFMHKQKRDTLVIYPFAHLSSRLAEPKEAMDLLDSMYKNVPKDVKAIKAPFGWNKKLSFSIKGHPLAEMSRNYGDAEKEPRTQKKVKAKAVNTSIVRKSDWAGLPENDHRKIGEKLDLYSFQEVSPAMVYWHPNGFRIYRELINFIREKEEKYGYLEISTPALANTALWQVSGHDAHYKDNMFTFESNIGDIGLKPMNCPSSILIYKSKSWSYRDLPFRTAIFDRLYRSELSGVATGLFRVKELTQDDGHIFLREDQVESELAALLKMVKEVYDTFELKFTAKLSTMPDDHAGEEETWKKATSHLKHALDTNKMKYEIKEKEGSFYAPKIDFDVVDSQGRTWQCATIQLDYQMPTRFKIAYIGEDGKEHTPIIIHRAILGSLERFIGIMVEHYQGKFPTWLAPVQAKVVSISDQSNKYAEKTFEKVKDEKIRVQMDISDKTFQYKLREALNEKVPYIVILGKKEEENGLVTIRSRSGTQKTGIKLDGFLKELQKEVGDRENKTYF